MIAMIVVQKYHKKKGHAVYNINDISKKMTTFGDFVKPLDFAIPPHSHFNSTERT